MTSQELSASSRVVCSSAFSVGKLLRIYDLGKKKMLRKCENKVRRLSGEELRIFPVSAHITVSQG